MAWTASRVQYGEVAALQEALGCPEVLAWVLVRRGLADPEAAREFLAADGPLSPPEDIPGIADAADRLVKAIRSGERIVVHGDYDCDGICSTAIVLEAVLARGGDARPFLPSRFTDGYGVSIETVERLADEGCDVLLTVDCGTTAVDALTRAGELGIESIVADHHLAAGRRPPAIIANPALGHGRDDLPAAAGVAFKLMQAVSARLDGDRLAPAADSGIDLVALATIADAVPLVGENRRLVARGLAAIHARPRAGLAALCRAASVAPRSVTARELGWNLAPAINAAGRMDHPLRALDVLLGEEGAETDSRARALWDLNVERRAVEQEVTADAIGILEASPPEIRDAAAVVVSGEGWHEGVVGIVASRLVEHFGRPAIVLSVAGESAKGSGRSLPGVDLHSLVGSAAGHLERWGGHAGAVGVQMRADAIPAFRADFSQSASAVRAQIERARVRSVDAVVSVQDLSLQTAEALDALQPFGTANPEVSFVIPGVVVEDVATIGKDRQHLQVRMRSGGAHVRGLAWRQGARADAIPVGERVDAVVGLDIERWQDLVGPRVTLHHLDPVDDTSAQATECTTPCDASCPVRTALDVHELGDATGSVARSVGSPRAVRDRRNRGSAISQTVALCGADDGVIAVVADVAVRRDVVETLLHPSRVGVHSAVLAGERCEMSAALDRFERAQAGPRLIVTDPRSIVHIPEAGAAHVVVIDPPADAQEHANIVGAADGRWLHLVYGDDEIAVAHELVDARWDVRGIAAQIWRVAAKSGRVGKGELSALKPRPEAPSYPAEWVARAVRSLVELDRVTVTPDGLEVRSTPDGGALADTETGAEAATRRLEQHAFLDRALTLDFRESAISLS